MLLAVCCGIMVVAVEQSFAIRLLTKEEAIKGVFGPGAVVVVETKQLKESHLAKVTERMGGSLVSAQKGSKSSEVAAKTSYDFIFSMKDGKKDKVAIIDEEPGKWGPVEFIVAMDLKGAITRVDVLSYQEKRGQPIARHSFMSQFEGKSSKDKIMVNKDINGVSGATISSNCATFAVRKAIALYEELYLK